MKKVLSLILASLMLVAVLAACGSPAEPVATPVPTPESGDPINTPQSTEEYQTLIGEFTTSFDSIVNNRVVALVANLDTVVGTEGFDAWSTEFDAIYDDILAEMDNLSLASLAVTDEFVDQLLEITVNAAAVYEVFATFEPSVTAAAEGNMDEFEANRGAFVTGMNAAIEGWNATGAQ